MSKKILIIFTVLLFSLFLRLYNLYAAGRAWDEQYYVEQGYTLHGLLKDEDFTSSYWYTSPDPPIISKLIYGIGAKFDYVTTTNHKHIFSYDLNITRLISVVFSLLSIVLIIFIGWRYISFATGIIAGVILSTLPYFLGLSQLVSMESLLVFFFSLTAFSYLYYFEKTSLRRLLLAGILSGICFSLKYTNVMLIPLFVCFYYTFLPIKLKKKNLILFINRLITLCITACITCFLLWPQAFFHFQFVMQFEKELRFSIFSAPPELFFGTFKKNPIVYYIVYFFITTPLLYLLLFFIGGKKIFQARSKTMLILAIWFLLPFAQSLYPFRQNGIRYIIQIYAPFSLIAAIGFESIAQKYTKKIFLQFVFFLPILLVILTTLFRISPYYLDYFNSLVGGTKNVYEKRLFPLGWWGSGEKEAAVYIENHAKKNSKIGLELTPYDTWKFSNKMQYSHYDNKKVYDYVIVNHFSVIRAFFDPKTLQKNYKIVYSVKADGARLVDVYQRK